MQTLSGLSGAARCKRTPDPQHCDQRPQGGIKLTVGSSSRWDQPHEITRASVCLMSTIVTACVIREVAQLPAVLQDGEHDRRYALSSCTKMLNYTKKVVFLVVDGKPGRLDGNQTEIGPAALLRAHTLLSQTDICAIKVAPLDQVLMLLLPWRSVITHRAHLGRLSRSCHAISEKQHSGAAMLCQIGKPLSGSSDCSSISSSIVSHCEPVVS